MPSARMLADGPDGRQGDHDDQSCDCKTCRFFYGIDLPVIAPLPIEKLIVETRSQSIHIFRTWIQLNAVLKRFEAVIRKRWLKKTFSQKNSILSEVWPGIATVSRPDFASLRDGCARHRKRPSVAKTRELHLWPFINLEDLNKPGTLLSYINVRGRNLPWRFAHADWYTAHTEELPVNPGVDKYRMRIYDCKTPKSYGAPLLLSAKRCGKDMWGLKLTMLAFHPYKAHLVMEIQSRILDFLLACSHAILRDHDMSTLCMQPTIAVPALPLLTATTHDITYLAAAACYELPGCFNHDQISSLLATREMQAADHLWSLREDPGYFAMHLREWTEHDPARILDKHKEMHSIIDNPTYWGRNAARMITHAYTAFALWHDAGSLCDYLHYDISELKFLDKHRHPDAVYVRDSLRTSFQLFDAHLKQMLQWPLYDLSMGFCASPPFRSSFQRPQTLKDPSLSQLNYNCPLKQTGQVRLYTLIRCILQDEQHRLHGLSNIIEEIQRTIDTETERHLISPWVADRFADLALTAEISRQVDMFQPFATIWRGNFDDDDDFANSDAMGPIMAMYGDLEHAVANVQYPLEGLRPAMFDYPCDKKPTAKTIAIMRSSENSLDHFWKIFDECIGPAKLIAQSRSLQRTPPWESHPASQVDSAPTATKAEEDDIVNVAPSGILSDCDPNARLARPTRAELMVTTPTRLDKPKTKGVATPTTTESTGLRCSNLSLDEQPPVPKVFFVNKRAYKVFAIILHVPDGHPITADVPWIELLNAMSSLGFATEKLYGSSWQFTPPPDLPAINGSRNNNKKHQPIQLHQPHPSPKLRYWEAKRFGRRLSRHYGWDGSMFGCK